MSRISARRAARRAARQAPAAEPRTRASYEQLEGRTLLSVSQDADGFTVVGPAGDSNVIYVSSSGNDSNAGNSPNAAVRTIARGKSLLRNGSADQLLFKRGDTFTGNFGIWNLSGRSESEPMLIGTYGEGARPLINTGSASGLVGGRDAINHLVIQGLHFNASSRDPDGGSFAGTAGGSYGIQSLAPMNDILIEDVAVENYKFNISIQKFYGDINDVTVRRSVITDAYSEPGGGHSSGLYAYGIHGFTLEDNVFDHNGWLSDKVPSAKQTVFNHNAYLKENLTGVTVTGNIFSNASSHGLQARSGGVVQNNLFLNNPVHMSFGLINGAPPYVGGVSGEVSGNVYLGGRSINNSARGWALEIGNTSKAADTIVKDNIIAHDTQGYFPAISLNYGNNVEQPEGYAGLHNLTLQNNIVYKWYQSLALSSGFQAGGTGLRSLSNLTIADNQFQMTGSARIISHGNGYTAGNENWNGNSYYTNKSPSGWFSIGGNTTSFGTWQSQIDGSASDQPISYDDPDRNPGTYNEELGGEGTLTAFMAEARKQTQGTYRPEYTAAPVVSYIRQGFGLEGSSPVAGPRVTLTASDLGSGDTDQVITVTYRSPAGVDEGSLDSQDLTVTGPNGYSAAAEFLSSTPGTNGAIVAKYRVPAPKGAWDAEDDGTYTVTLNTGQVQDGAGTDFPGRSLGGFNVQYGTPTFPPPPGGVPPAGGEFPPGTEPGAPAPSFPPPPGIDPTPGGAGPTPTPTPTTPTPTPTPTEPVPTPTPTPTDPVPTPTPTPTGTQPTGAFPTGGSPGFAVLEVNAETGVTVGNAATAIDLVDNYDIAAQPGNAADADDADAIMKYGVPQLNLVATRFAQFPTAAQFGHDNIAIVVAGVVDVVSGTSGEFTVGLLSPGAARLFVNGTVAVDLAADDTDGLAEATLTLKDGDTLRVVHAEVDAPQGSEALIVYTKNAVTGGTGGGGTGGGGTGAPTPSSGQTVVGAEGSPLAITAPSDPLGPLAGATPGGGTGAPTPTPTPTPTFPGVPPIGPSPANPDGSSTPPPDTRAPIVRQSAYVQMAQADRVELRFTEDVGATLSLEDLVIRDTATGAVVPAAGMKMSYDSSTLTAVVTFPGLTNAELEPGRYTVTLLGSGISDAANNALDGNGDGQGGDNFTMTFDKL